MLTPKDKAILNRLAVPLAPLVQLERIGVYRSMSIEQVWWRLLGQVCVMGSSRPWDQAQRRPNARKILAYSAMARHPKAEEYLRDALQSLKATRFPSKAAAKLVAALKSPAVFRGGRVRLFEGLSHRDDPHAVREELIRRCPMFRLKSASDFMISVGLSRDVVALDVRILGYLGKYCESTLKASSVRSNKRLYLSVEAALRDYCREQQLDLAVLDRLLFKYSSLTVAEFLESNPGVELSLPQRRRLTTPSS